MSYYKPSHTFIHERFVHKYSRMHTLQPQNASIIQNQKFLCLCLLSVFITYSFCLVALLGATWQGWRFSLWSGLFIFLPSHLSVSLAQTVAPNQFLLILPARATDFSSVVFKRTGDVYFPDLIFVVLEVNKMTMMGCQHTVNTLI